MTNRHQIQFPSTDASQLPQDEVRFYLREGGRRVELRFHDYDRIYKRPGLYEQLFYDRLKCNSPRKVSEILKRTIESVGENFNGLRVLDLGAGNGMMGEELKRHGVARLVGVDIIEEAKAACERDRPGLYDDYLVADFTCLTAGQREELENWSIDCLVSVAALGFGDIPPKAFFEALQLVACGGWVAFNIKVTFLDRSDKSGFSRFIRELIFSEYLDVYHMEKYRHRLSMEGTHLHYFAVVARKTALIPANFMDWHEDHG